MNKRASSNWSSCSSQRSYLEQSKSQGTIAPSIERSLKHMVFCSVLVERSIECRNFVRKARKLEKTQMASALENNVISFSSSHLRIWFKKRHHLSHVIHLPTQRSKANGDNLEDNSPMLEQLLHNPLPICRNISQPICYHSLLEESFRILLGLI
jgi:hypothetical protein